MFLLIYFYLKVDIGDGEYIVVVELHSHIGLNRALVKLSAVGRVFVSDTPTRVLMI